MKNKNHIIGLIGKNHLEEAIQEMKSKNDDSFTSELIQIEGRLNELKRKIKLGLLSNIEQEQERNKIAYSLIEIASGNPTLPKKAESTMLSSRSRILVFSLLLLAVILFTLLTANKTLPFSGMNGASYLVYVLCGLLAAFTCYGL